MNANWWGSFIVGLIIGAAIGGASCAVVVDAIKHGQWFWNA